MNRILKCVIFVVGVISILIVLVLNLVFVTNISENEIITYKINNIIYLIRNSTYYAYYIQHM